MCCTSYLFNGGMCVGPMDSLSVSYECLLRRPYCVHHLTSLKPRKSELSYLKLTR